MMRRWISAGVLLLLAGLGEAPALAGGDVARARALLEGYRKYQDAAPPSSGIVEYRREEVFGGFKQEEFVHYAYDDKRFALRTAMSPYMKGFGGVTTTNSGWLTCYRWFNGLNIVSGCAGEEVEEAAQIWEVASGENSGSSRLQRDSQVAFLLGRDDKTGVPPDPEELTSMAEDQFSYVVQRGPLGPAKVTITVLVVDGDVVLPTRVYTTLGYSGGESESAWDGWSKRGNLWMPAVATWSHSVVTKSRPSLGGQPGYSETASQEIVYELLDAREMGEPLHAGRFIPVLPNDPDLKILDREWPFRRIPKLSELSIFP